MSTSTYTVLGMTCEHCVASVTEEVTQMIPDVAEVEVDLATGGLTVTTTVPTAPVDRDAVRAAVVEAGYEIAEPTMTETQWR